MQLDTLRIQNLRSISDSGNLEFGKINIFVGPNNGGKSTILFAILRLQVSNNLEAKDFRINAAPPKLHAVLSGEGVHDPWGLSQMEIVLSANEGDRVLGPRSETQPQPTLAFQQFPNTEPGNLLYQYLSKRQVFGFERQINQNNASVIAPDLRYLVSRVSRLANPASPSHQKYWKACEDIIGFPISEFPFRDGQMAGLLVDNFHFISLEDMGTGVTNIVGLLVDLCVAQSKIFILEEPENDIHPKALKSLLALVAEGSSTNQFFVSTHSHIVLRHLGSLPDARVFTVSPIPGALPPTSEVRRLSETPEARLAALDDLGYELLDFELFDGWIVFEESSAERIVRSYLIPWFVPRLSRVRTVAAGGTSKVEPTFDDLVRLIVFAHLEPVYRDRAFVLVDGDEAGISVVEDLRTKFADWDPSYFRSFSAHDFEMYFPAPFSEQVSEILSNPDRGGRRIAKRELLDRLLKWTEEDRDRAKRLFAESFAPVIAVLDAIDKKLFG